MSCLRVEFQCLLQEGHKPEWREKNFALPAGKTCLDCFAFLFCSGIGCAKAENTWCDYYPVRFREAMQAKTPQP